MGTVGKSWTSGTFGCVRSNGQQIHEGIDIRCLQRDRQGEPTDPILAAAEGTVAYLNPQSGLSNYGLYLVLKHSVEGLEVYSLYAHLRQIQPGLRVGDAVRAGAQIGIMGRTTNTRERISQDRAHVHFELGLLLNERFASWYRQAYPGQRNDHGLWNGLNLAGLDARKIFLEQARLGARFSLLRWVRQQDELCRVIVRATRFPWLHRYAPLIRRHLPAETEGIAGFEVVFNFNGVPFQLTPLAASEIPGSAKYQLRSVNAAEQQRNPGGQLVAREAGKWKLARKGLLRLELLTY